MGLLIYSEDVLKNHASIGFNFSYNVIKPYLKQAERDHVVSIIGEALYTSWATDAPDTANPKKVYNLLCEAAANMALFLYIPLGVVIISDNGIMIQTSGNTQSAEWWQIRDLQRSLLKTSMSAIDNALKILEANEADFPTWVNTEGYTVFKELYVPKTGDFNKHFNINSCRRSFMALAPYQREVQAMAFNWIDSSTLAVILAAASSEAKQAREYLRAAQVNLVVAKAVKSGMFLLAGNSITVKFMDIPGEKNKEVDPSVLDYFAIPRIQAADNYMSMLKSYLGDNETAFPDYTEPTPGEGRAHNTRSSLSL